MHRFPPGQDWIDEALLLLELVLKRLLVLLCDVCEDDRQRSGNCMQSGTMLDVREDELLLPTHLQHCPVQPLTPHDAEGHSRRAPAGQSMVTRLQIFASASNITVQRELAGHETLENDDELLRELECEEELLLELLVDVEELLLLEELLRELECVVVELPELGCDVAELPELGCEVTELLEAPDREEVPLDLDVAEELWEATLTEDLRDDDERQSDGNLSQTDSLLELCEEGVLLCLDVVTELPELGCEVVELLELGCDGTEPPELGCETELPA